MNGNGNRKIFYKITEELDGATVGGVLKNRMKLSTGLIARLKRVDGGILLNGSPAHTNVKVHTGDEVGAVIGDAGPAEGSAAFPYPILYEDEDILAIDKPAGSAAHGSRYDDAVEDIGGAVRAYLGSGAMYHPVNRLDKGTTGVMLIAKNGYMHSLLAQYLHTQALSRQYIGIVAGDASAMGASGRIDLPIGRVEGSALKREVREDGAKAVTIYEAIGTTTIGAGADEITATVMRFRLETGRTHQIRAHMAASGYPLVGDWLYGTENRALITRPALHSEELSFIHPLTGERITLNAPLPEDMRRLTGKVLLLGTF